jgi:hypothetical protein
MRSLDQVVFEADNGIIGFRHGKTISDRHSQGATSPIDFACAPDHQVSFFNGTDKLAGRGLLHIPEPMIHPGMTCSIAPPHH